MKLACVHTDSNLTVGYLQDAVLFLPDKGPDSRTSIRLRGTREEQVGWTELL